MANLPLSDELCQQAVDAVAAHGSISAASRGLRLPYGTFVTRHNSAVRRGFEPKVQVLLAGDNAGAPEGYKLKGTSTLYGEDGKAKLQWVKTNADQEAIEALQRAVLAELCKELKPAPRIKAPKIADADLATLYTMTDCHVGMLSWDKETGEDWDLSIAENCLVGTLLQMIEAAPKSAVGILNQLGDFLHIDSLQPLTPTNHHVLDADSRYQKMVVVAVRILRRVISAMLEKHATVKVFMAEGNHDPAGSVWLRIMFAQLYENNPRVTVGMSPNPYVAYEHGKVMLGFYHGHLAKKISLGELFASQFREMWGRCEYVYIHTGHLHNHEEQERRGCKLIQHATLSAPDAYAARAGFLSKRQAVSMTYHVSRGEIARGVFVP